MADSKAPWCTSRLDERVKLRNSFGEDDVPSTIPFCFKRAVQSFPNSHALAYKKHDQWNFVTYDEYLHSVRTVANAFLKLGLKRRESVCILGANTPEWAIAHFAAIFAGGISSGLYPTNSAESCLHCLRTSNAYVVVVEDDAQLRKILEIRSQAPNLKIIIQYSGTPNDPSVLSWNELMTIGSAEPDCKLDEIIESLVANECCTILYTSGTTSLPKAVMLSHDNVIFSAKMSKKYLRLRDTAERCLSYLPVSHVAGQSYDFYMTLLSGSCCYFADKNALKYREVLIKNLTEVKPTYFFGVPRIWEKIQEHILLIEKCLPELTELGVMECSGPLSRYATQLNVKSQVGLDKCHANMVGAAPLSIEFKEYLSKFDITIGEVYGMTETGGPHIICSDADIDFRSIGKALPGMRMKIDQPDENEVGEVCMYGRNIFMGYLHEPEKTKETIDADGWLHTGDQGKFNEKSCLQMCGRIKELIITSGGENVAPVLIEAAIKSELPILSHAIVVGDRKKYLSLLITLKCQINGDNGTPSDELSPEVKAWCRSLNCKYDTASAIVRDRPEPVYEAIQKGIDRANTKAISRVHQIRKFAILPKDLSLLTGELGPTLKTMRHVVCAKYKAEIESLYC